MTPEDRLPCATSSRREALRLLGVAGVALATRGIGLEAQQSSGGRIDVHHHFFRPTAATKRFVAHWPVPGPYVNWTPKASIEAMDEAGIEVALLSCPLSFGDTPRQIAADIRAASRDLNEYGAQLVGQNRGRYRFFAMLPLPDVDGSLRELEYALDTLRATGVGLVTSYGDQWLGDDAFVPVFEELDRRRVIVHVHPMDAPCCHRVVPDTDPQTIEWNTNTARAIWSLINDGTSAEPRRSKATRFKNVTFIWSHAGGSLLGLASRMIGSGGLVDALNSSPPSDSRLYHLRRFYYDTAASTNPVQMPALKSLVGTSQIVFGSDYPGPVTRYLEWLHKSGLSPDDYEQIERQNARLLLNGRA